MSGPPGPPRHSWEKSMGDKKGTPTTHTLPTSLLGGLLQ